MRLLIKAGFLLGLTISTSAYTADPVEGFYFGVLGGISHSPNTQLNFTINNTAYNGEVTLEPVGGGGGFSLGYKINRFRLEGEFFFNINNYDTLRVNSCTLVSPNVLSPEGTCPAFITDNGLGFKGSTMDFYGLFNVFYDFLSSDPNVNFFPYVGLGLGGAIVKNNGQVQNNKFFADGYTPIVVSKGFSNSGFAGQGIVGISSYVDDFTTLGVDFRYLSTFNSGNGNRVNTPNWVATINFTANFALDKGAN